MHTHASKGLIFGMYFFQIDPIKDSGLVISSSYHCLRQHNHPEESWWVEYVNFVSGSLHTEISKMMAVLIMLSWYLRVTSQWPKKLMDKSKAGKTWIGQ